MTSQEIYSFLLKKNPELNSTLEFILSENIHGLAYQELTKEILIQFGVKKFGDQSAILRWQSNKTLSPISIYSNNSPISKNNSKEVLNNFAEVI